MWFFVLVFLEMLLTSGAVLVFALQMHRLSRCKKTAQERPRLKKHAIAAGIVAGVLLAAMLVLLFFVFLLLRGMLDSPVPSSTDAALRSLQQLPAFGV